MQCITDAWNTYQHELLRFVVKRIPDIEESQDVVQEAFLRAMKLEHGLCGIESPRAWLFQVVRNLLIDRYRLSKDELPVEDENLPSPEPEPTAPVDSLSQCLPRVLSELSAEDREVITLCDIEGLTQERFAARLGLSLPAAKSRIQRARKRLRTQMVTACQVKFDETGQVCCFVPRPPLK